ncbi:hypothetical protein [Micromonospora zhanjiangensis]|uniref:DUF2269 domain-containing protein n=1 Tax=Micromonospora zhanjiangensis TaxID=1522057 RepID=A0ABV8KNI6_9ACTN
MVSLPTTGPRPFRLGARTRKTVLVAHIATAGAWLGIDVVLGILVVTALSTGDADTRALCYRALELFAVWPLFVVGVGCLASGVLLGLGSRYGVVRYWWVAVKLVLNLVLVVLVLIALRPGVADLAEVGRQIAAGRLSAAGPGDMIFPPVVSTAALLLATVLSVFKPWGRTRRRIPGRPAGGRSEARRDVRSLVG